MITLHRVDHSLEKPRGKMSIRSTVFLLLAVWCVTLQYVAADEPQRSPACDEPIVPGKITRFCDGISTHYGYDSTSGQCVGFRDTGCPGSRNNFYTLEECQEACIV